MQSCGSLANHLRVYMEVVTHSTKSLGAIGNPPLRVPQGSRTQTQLWSSPLHCSRGGESKQGSPSPVPPEAPTEVWEGRFWLGMGWQVPGLGVSPAAGTLTRRCSCVQEREGGGLSRASSMPHHALFEGPFRLFSSL